MKNRYRVVENKSSRSWVVIDSVTGRAMHETVNPATAAQFCEGLNLATND